MRKLYLFAAFLVLYEFTSYSANDMIMPGMLAVIQEFNAPLSYVAASLSLYMFGECVVQLWLGPLAERYGKRRIIIWGNLSFLVFTIFIALSQNSTQFMLGRFLQGSGMSFIAMGYALIHEKFNDKDAVRIIAIMGNISILAPLAGPLIGGIIISHANWHYIFILSGVLGLISLIGLYNYAPSSSTLEQKIKFNQIFGIYRQIIKDHTFSLGLWATIAGAMPLLIWIGLAPNLILHHLHLNYHAYIIYQLIALSGLLVSSLSMQFLAGKWQFHQLIRRGCYISFAGIFFSFISHSSILLLSIGLFFYSIGLGLSNGSIIRIIMSNKTYSQNMSASLMTFSQTLCFAIGIEFSDFICAKFDYSPFSFSLISLFFGIGALFLNRRFAQQNLHRQWQ